MNWFPQIGAGSIAQFPVTRLRQWRTIANEMESGERITLADEYSNQIGWQLSYQDLTDAEVQNLSSLFSASQGGALQFGFVDPLANVLGWSEDLTRPDWQTNLLAIAPNAVDPLGTQRAWTLTNTTTGVLSLQQTLAISGNYVACFSVWVSSPSAASVTLQHDSTQNTQPVGPAWNRIFISGQGASGAANSTFGIALNPSQQVMIFGPQVEAQPYPSAYKQTVTARGIYPNTWFVQDELQVVSTGPGLSSCQFALRSQI